MACNSDRRDDQNNALSSVSTPSMTPSRPPQSPGSKYSSCVLLQRAQRSNPSQAGRKNSWAMVSGTHWSDATIIVKNTLTESPPIPDQPEYAPATLRAFRQLHEAIARAIRMPYFEDGALVGEYDLENVKSATTASVRGPERRMGVDESLGVVISVHRVRDGVELVVELVVVIVKVVVVVVVVMMVVVVGAGAVATATHDDEHDDRRCANNKSVDATTKSASSPSPPVRPAPPCPSAVLHCPHPLPPIVVVSSVSRTHDARGTYSADWLSRSYAEAETPRLRLAETRRPRGLEVNQWPVDKSTAATVVSAAIRPRYAGGGLDPDEPLSEAEEWGEAHTRGLEKDIFEESAGNVRELAALERVPLKRPATGGMGVWTGLEVSQNVGDNWSSGNAKIGGGRARVEARWSGRLLGVLAVRGQDADALSHCDTRGGVDEGGRAGWHRDTKSRTADTTVDTELGKDASKVKLSLRAVHSCAKSQSISLGKPTQVNRDAISIGAERNGKDTYRG
ncbi:hypothetical protein GGX14DRAFT_403918 [Mycena pura]|uniref:Uncharacterized protein n=1 Tax=Mycena pura TaxID=153505 RepID=A0AAD6UV11_9AGAR|nr:hypothetical protein GGX14DRAFT_403918 [Mycena pura]